MSLSLSSRLNVRTPGGRFEDLLKKEKKGVGRAPAENQAKKVDARANHALLKPYPSLNPIPLNPPPPKLSQPQTQFIPVLNSTSNPTTQRKPCWSRTWNSHPVAESPATVPPGPSPVGGDIANERSSLRRDRSRFEGEAGGSRFSGGGALELGLGRRARLPTSPANELFRTCQNQNQTHYMFFLR